MLDANDLVKLIRKAAVEAVKAEKPTETTYGIVISSDPLVVEVDQKIKLGERQLKVGESLQEHEAEVEVEIENLELELSLVLDGKTVTAKASGNGLVKGKAKVKRSLEEGTKVFLMRTQGGQDYTMYDKVKEHDA